MPHSVLQSIERVRQLMDCAISRTLAPLVENAHPIDQVMSWLEDDESRLIYGRELTFQCLRHVMSVESARKYAGNMQFDEMQQYYAACRKMLDEGQLPDIDFAGNHENRLNSMTDVFVVQGYRHHTVAIEPGDVLIDAGAYVGDSMIYALLQGAAEVHSFEPDPDNAVQFERNRQKLAPEARVFCIQKGLGKEEGTVRFYKNTCASRVGSYGDVEVGITTLDAYCRERQVVPTFIKMDVEGSEPLALQGAQETLSTHAPKLCICLYHNLSDMWTVPTIIKSIRPDYRFWVRSNHPQFEFNLYARV